MEMTNETTPPNETTLDPQVGEGGVAPRPAPVKRTAPAKPKKPRIGGAPSDPLADMLTRVRNGAGARHETVTIPARDRKSTRLNSSHSQNSYAVFCLKKKKHKL